MVSHRCKLAVKSVLDKMGLHYGTVDLGKVEVEEDLTEAQQQGLKEGLSKVGLLMMDDRKAVLIEKIKSIVIEMVHYTDKWPLVNFSDYLAEKLHQDYNHLSHLFSEVTGTTIERFIIAHKIELVKELLLYDELSLTEISYRLNYSSVAHLSTQFKNVTGLTPTYFKQLKQFKQRINLEDV